MADLLAALLLIAATAGFVAWGLVVSRREGGGRLSGYLVAGRSVTATSGTATLLATSFGSWMLFAPAEAATWGGVAAVLGYAIGNIAPRLAFLVLGPSMRRAMPGGHSLIEFVYVRYGKALYALVLVVTLGYLGTSLAANATGIVKVMDVIAELPAWLPALVLLAGALVYTAWGGLAASIVTDRAQLWVIAVFLAAVAAIGAVAVDGGAQLAALKSERPELLNPANPAGLDTAAGLVLGILFAGLVSQANWQRVFAMTSERALKQSLAYASLIGGPVIFLMGLFGLAHVALGLDDASVAVFAVLQQVVPAWALTLLAVLVAALVLSSLDTSLNAIASLVALLARAVKPAMAERATVRLAGLAVTLVSLAVLAVAVQGYSVLYLFLVADLLCAALAVPVFAGLYLRRVGAGIAGLGVVVGLAAGGWAFPPPDMGSGSLGLAFALAGLAPAAVLPLAWLGRPRRFDFARLKAEVRPFEAPAAPDNPE